MKRNDEQRHDELVDLGAVADETKGIGSVPPDSEGGLRKSPGLSDD
jgi:hypothetical protein